MKPVLVAKERPGDSSAVFEFLESRKLFSIPIVGLQTLDPAAAESTSANPATVLLTRTGDVRRSLRVALDTTGTARLGDDYSIFHGSIRLVLPTVAFSIGQRRLRLTILPKDDPVAENTEFAKVSLEPSDSYRIGRNQRSSKITIVDNEPVVRLTTIDGAAAETGAVGPVDTAAFRFSRTGPDLTQPATISFRVSGSASTADYTTTPAISQSVMTIPSGSASVDLLINPLNDNQSELTETLNITLVRSERYSLGPRLERSATITIADFVAPPIPQLTLPTDGSALWGDNLISGQILGGRGERFGNYWFDDNSQNSIELNLSPKGEFQQSINLFGVPNGQHALVVEASDASGLLSQISLEIWVDVHQIYGLNFGPFTEAGEVPGTTTLTQTQLLQRLSSVARYTKWARFFGTRDGLEHAGMLAHQLGLKAAVGAWISRDSAGSEIEINNLIAAANAGEVDLAIVGSESLLRGDVSSDQLIAYMDRVRTAIPQGIPVVTADTYNTLLENPNVVAASDMFFANVYPYWEGKDVHDGVASLPAVYRTLVDNAQGKPVVFSEVGWPSAGSSLGNAEPSVANAAFYFSNVSDWARTTGVHVFYFEAFDEPWKTEWSVGPYWGILNNGQLKPGYGDIFRGQTDDSWRGVVIDGPGEPSISYTSVPPLGSFQDLQGRIGHVNPVDHKVGVYINVQGRWWIKPTAANPNVAIGFDGTWTADITTGGVDQASEIIAFLVPLDYSLPIILGAFALPDELYNNSLASVRQHRE